MSARVNERQPLQVGSLLTAGLVVVEDGDADGAGAPVADGDAQDLGELVGVLAFFEVQPVVVQAGLVGVVGDAAPLVSLVA
jgi:hypothetical protein